MSYAVRNYVAAAEPQAIFEVITATCLHVVSRPVAKGSKVLLPELNMFHLGVDDIHTSLTQCHMHIERAEISCIGMGCTGLDWKGQQVEIDL